MKKAQKERKLAAERQKKRDEEEAKNAAKDPFGGKINRDKEGNPNGVLVDKASLLVENLIPKKTYKQEKKVTGYHSYIIV